MTVHFLARMIFLLLAKLLGLAMLVIGGGYVSLVFGFATLIDPKPETDWWPRYWLHLWDTAGVVAPMIGILLALVGGGLLALPWPVDKYEPSKGVDREW